MCTNQKNLCHNSLCESFSAEKFNNINVLAKIAIKCCKKLLCKNLTYLSQLLYKCKSVSAEVFKNANLVARFSYKILQKYLQKFIMQNSQRLATTLL